MLIADKYPSTLKKPIRFSTFNYLKIISGHKHTAYEMIIDIKYFCVFDSLYPSISSSSESLTGDCTSFKRDGIPLLLKKKEPIHQCILSEQHFSNSQVHDSAILRLGIYTILLNIHIVCTINLNIKLYRIINYLTFILL